MDISFQRMMNFSVNMFLNIMIDLNLSQIFQDLLVFHLILKEKNYLFVDGRYTLQANKQCGKFFKIITIPTKLPKISLKKKKLSIGFDPRIFTKKSLEILFGKAKCKLNLLKII